jgi:HK97 family phage major capsid protein
MENDLSAKMDEISVKNARKVVEAMLVERSVRGLDRTGLTSDQKKDFAAQVISAFKGHESKAIRVKANEALIGEQDNRGGYLVEPEVAAAIMRIAASVGTIMKQCQMWPMKGDELGIPNYTGSFLTGSYIGVDLPGVTTGLTFGQAVLIARKWQLAFTVGNDLLADASVNLGEWLLAIAGEALANMVDQQGFVGGTVTTAPGPFVGILNAPNTNTYSLGNSTTSGKTHMTDFNPVTDAANIVATLEESILDGAAWYMHRTVWASIRSQLASSSGLPFLFLSGAGSELKNNAGGGPIKPAGEMAGYPVFTNRWLPTLVTTVTASTAFVIFGNMKACAFGDKGDIRVGNFQSGSFGGIGRPERHCLQAPPRIRSRSSQGVYGRQYLGVLTLIFPSSLGFPQSGLAGKGIQQLFSNSSNKLPVDQFRGITKMVFPFRLSLITSRKAGAKIQIHAHKRIRRHQGSDECKAAVAHRLNSGDRRFR